MVAEGQQALPEVGVEVGGPPDPHGVDAVPRLHAGGDRLVLQAVPPDVLALHGELAIEEGEEGELHVDRGRPGVCVVYLAVHQVGAGLHQSLAPRHCQHAVGDEILAVLGGPALRVGAPKHQPQLHVAQVVPALPGQRPQHRHVQLLLAALEASRPPIRPATQPGPEQDQQGRQAQGQGLGQASPVQLAAPHLLQDPEVAEVGRPWPGAERGSASKPGGTQPCSGPSPSWRPLPGACPGSPPNRGARRSLIRSTKAHEADSRLEVRAG